MKKIILVTKDQFDWYWEALMPQERFADPELSDLNVVNLRYSIFPVTFFPPPKGWEIIDFRKLPMEMKVWRNKVWEEQLKSTNYEAVEC